MERRANERGISGLELIIALSVVGIVVLATLLSPNLGIQAGLTGIAILMNLRQSRRS